MRGKPGAAGLPARTVTLLATLCLVAATAGSAAARTASRSDTGVTRRGDVELASSRRSARAIPSTSMRALPLKAPVVAMAATPSGRGAWRVGADGGVFTSGDAHYYGSTGGEHLNQPIVGMASTPSGRGYWFVASDGGVFAFGNAHFYGSTGGMHLNQPIVGGAATRSGRGYWFVASDGGVFSFGNARFKGSVGGAHLTQPVVGMAPAQGGYLLLTANGRVFNFGGAHNYGSATHSCPGAPAVAIATSPRARGYWIAFTNARAYALSPNAKAPRCTAATRKRLTASKSGAAAIDLFNRLNDERRARGLAPLSWDAGLASYASQWSKVMGGSADLHHSNIGNLLGPYDYVGENIAMGSQGVPASALHNNWMHSQAHRDNILSPGFQSVGIGVYCAPNGSIWATQEFGRPSTSGPPPPYSANTPQNPVVRTDADNLGC